MAIKVGNSWVSEAAYAQAKAKIDGEQHTNLGGTVSKNDYLRSLQNKFLGCNITINTQPYGGTGIYNIGISPNILNQMANNPDKRLEYESLVIDRIELSKTLTSAFKGKGLNLISHGFIIGTDGGLSSWSVIGPDTVSKKSAYSLLPKDNKNSWQNIISGSFQNKIETNSAVKVAITGLGGVK